MSRTLACKVPLLRKGLIDALVLTLCASLFLAPITLRASWRQALPSRSQRFASPQSAAPLSVPTKTTGSGVKSFIVETVNGESKCRDAEPAEIRLTLPRPDDRGVPVRELLPADRASAATPSSPTGLTINLVALSQLQTDPNRATVIAAFQRAAANWTSQIKSPVTITINIDYGTQMPGGGAFDTQVLGSTSSKETVIDYSGARTNLLASASTPAEASLYSSLPNSEVPVDAGNGQVVTASRSVAFALGLPVTNPSDDNVATIAFNKNHAFDFNPDDGITPFNRTDFVAVATHEIGHALGFTSNEGEGSIATVTLWDLFRFRPGTTVSSFSTAQRIMSIGGEQAYFTGQTFVVSGFSQTELALSTGGQDGVGGDGNQSSHWKDDALQGGRFIGIMDPTIPSGVREDTTPNDYSALETIGWNLVSTAPIPPPPPAPPAPPNDNFASAQIISSCFGTITGTNVGATQEAGERNHSPDGGGGHRSVWYNWTSPQTGTLTITTAGSSFDTVLGVYTGNSVDTTTIIGQNDDVASGNTSSSVTFSATAGTVYHIAVGGYDNGNSGGDMGPLKLNWSCGTAAPTILIGTPSFSKVEGDTMNVGVIRNGDASQPASVEYFTSDNAGNSNCNVANGNASSRCDYLARSGTLQFAPGETSKNIFIPTVNDSYHEGPETLTLTITNPVGASLGTPTVATGTLLDNDSSTTANPIDGADPFVTQQYSDFLNREPDNAGKIFWMNEITSCGADTQCVDVKRINVSAAFFLSIEFQETGYLVYRMYKAGFGNLPGKPVPVRLTEFLRDTQRVGEGVQVGIGSWEAQLEANKQAYAVSFVQRPEFLSAFNLSADQFVTKLDTNAGGVLSPSEKADLVSRLTPSPTDVTTRAFVLRAVAEDADLRSAEFNKAFVLMQYFGYLRRNPDDFPDADFGGFNFWLGKLNSFGGNFVNAEMVKGFLLSGEYRQRFGP